MTTTRRVDPGLRFLAESMKENVLQHKVLTLANPPHQPIRWLVQHSRAARVTDRDGRIRHRTPLGGHPGFPDLYIGQVGGPAGIADEGPEQGGAEE